jgi:cell division protein FtsQ
MRLLGFKKKSARSNNQSRDLGYQREKSNRKLTSGGDVRFRENEPKGGVLVVGIQTFLSGFFYVSLMVLTCITLLWFLRQVNNVEKFTIHRVEFVTPLKHIQSATLRQVSFPFTGENFFTANIFALKERLSHLPWVNQVTVSRVWPDTLSVRIKEQVPIARWQGNQWINTDLNFFKVAPFSAPQNLPEFKGQAGQLHLIWQNYQAIEKLLQPIKLHAVSVELSDRQSWRVKLNNGLILILGRSDGLDHLKRFVGVYHQLLAVQNPLAIDYIDLRYSNGMALHPHEPECKN